MAFKKVEITGGPHGKTIVPKLDGEILPAQRIELVFDVNDVVRMVTYQVVEARIDIEVLEAPEKGYTLHVVRPEIISRAGDVREIQYHPVVVGQGKTIAAALRDAAKRMGGQ